MTSDLYDYRTNFKDKPNSQGTLFQVNDKSLLNPAQRWPRGYTPERQAEVKGALADVPIKGRYEADAPHQRARVEDTVARSTIPVHHLSGLKNVDADVLPGTAGTYWPRQNRLAVNMLDRDDWKDDQSGQTLIHELGHHHDHTGFVQRDKVLHQVQTVAADHARRDWPHEGEPNISAGAMAERKVESGVREATADNYMEEHYRTRGRNPESVSEGRYEKHFTVAERQRTYPGYNDVRPPGGALGPQFTDKPLPGLSAAQVLRG